MRKAIVAGNWKMHKTPEAFRAFNDAFKTELEALKPLSTATAIFPPFPYLAEQVAYASEHDNFLTGAQNCHYEKEGAFTGEVSPEMLHAIGCTYVIIGHSERREHFAEDHPFLAKKVKAAQKHSLTPVFCCGEPLESRENGSPFAVVQKQVKKGLEHYDPSAGELVVAYEPVWAIGTGKTATPDQAREMHAFIRDQLKAKFGKDTADNTPILYGGSVKPDNAGELFASDDIDGGLIGGASLKVKDFAAILAIMEKQVIT